MFVTGHSSRRLVPEGTTVKVGEPVKIIKELPKKFKYWCGFSIGYPGNFTLGVQDGGHRP